MINETWNGTHEMLVIQELVIQADADAAADAVRLQAAIIVNIILTVLDLGIQLVRRLGPTGR